MQQPISRRDVYAPSLSATINGQAVEVESVEVDRALPNPLARDQLRAASARIVAAEGPDVVSEVATPWDPGTTWPPVPQSPASVSMDTGAGPVHLLGGGFVTSSGGGTSSRAVTVGLADRYESLNRTISWEPVADVMPSDSEAELGRWVSMQTISITDTILRHCGWYSTPPRLPGIKLSAPALGSIWTERGTVHTSQGSGGAYPGWLNAPWGVGVSDTDTVYEVGGVYTLGTRGRVEMVAMTATRPGEGTSRMDLLSDTGVLMARMAWSETSGSVWVRQGGALVSAATVPRSAGMLYCTIERLSNTSVRAIIRSGGASASGTATVDSAVTTSTMRRVRVVASSVSGGFQVATPATTGGLAGWEPNAVLYPRASNRNSLLVRPSVEGGNCADLLAEQCKAECATYWIDETGVLQWWDLARLESRSSVATLNSDDDIEEAGFEWQHDLSQVKSRVSVKWLDVVSSRSWRTSVDLWRGSGRTVQPGESVEEMIRVPDGEVWIMPGLSLSRLGPENLTDFNNGWGSHYGAVTRTSDDLDRWAQLSGSFLMSIEPVSDRAFKYTITWTGSVQAVMRAPSEASISDLWKIRRGLDLPILRGKAKYTLSERITYSAQSGPSTAPEYELDAGWWIQRSEQAQYTADYAAARLTVPQPVLSSVALIPVPGLQLGDVVEVADTHVSRLTIRGVVIEDSRSINSDMDMTHAVAIRPTHVTRNSVTWEEWGAVMNGRAWETWGSQQAGKTWEQWGANPLAGEEY